jgi:hypothetical protein
MAPDLGAILVSVMLACAAQAMYVLQVDARSACHATCLVRELRVMAPVEG